MFPFLPKPNYVLLRTCGGDNGIRNGECHSVEVVDGDDVCAAHCASSSDASDSSKEQAVNYTLREPRRSIGRFALFWLPVILVACFVVSLSKSHRNPPLGRVSLSDVVQKGAVQLLMSFFSYASGFDPQNFQCPLPGVLLSDGDPRPTNVRGCCEGYERSGWPFIFPECVPFSTCDSCFEHTPAVQISGHPVAPLAGVAWAASAAVHTEAEFKENVVIRTMSSWWDQVFSNEPLGITHGTAIGGMMRADVEWGLLAERNVVVCPDVQDWEVLSLDDSVDNVQARMYKSKSKKVAVVAFPGTQATSLTNWEIDASIYRSRLVLDSPRTTVTFHGGFLNVAQRLMPRIQQWVDGGPENEAVPEDWKLVFAGHSLGGALALLVATFAEALPWKRRPDATVTFGGPRVADKGLDAWWRARGLCDKLLRVNVYNDFVHWLPIADLLGQGTLDKAYSILTCVTSLKDCLRAEKNQSSRASLDMGDFWQHVCEDSEVLVPGSLVGINANLTNFSSLGGTLSHLLANCRFGYGYGVLNGTLAGMDEVCKIGPDVCLLR